MSVIILFNKPFNVLTQFRADGERVTLAQYIKDKSLRVAGRLDYDSEGLLLLTNDGGLNSAITEPTAKQYKTYWVQVDGLPDEAALEKLRHGVLLKDGITLPAEANIIEEPVGLWPRNPPIRYRANIPTTWLEIKICEGRNRQVRRMTAAVGFPTLRLIRAQIAMFTLGDLQPGEIRILPAADYAHLLLPSSTSRRPARAPSSKRSESRPRSRDERNARRKTLPIGPLGK
jgi:23S rRNA pseudouridine2457 synthase